GQASRRDHGRWRLPDGEHRALDRHPLRDSVPHPGRQQPLVLQRRAAPGARRQGAKPAGREPLDRPAHQRAGHRSGDDGARAGSRGHRPGDAARRVAPCDREGVAPRAGRRGVRGRCARGAGLRHQHGRLGREPETLTMLRVLLASLLVLSATSAPAQQWPTRPIRFVVPLPPGGSPDYLSRLLSEHLQPVLGQPLIVENKPGAGGGIARDFVAKAPPDGYTILMSESSHIMSAATGVRAPYNPISDFQPISLAATIPFGLTVNSAMPVHTLDEFIAYA